MLTNFEKCLSVFLTLLLTGLVGAEERCGQQDLIKCAKPLQVLGENSDLSFISSKEELVRLCPDLFNGIRCINNYTKRCMSGDQRAHFNRLYRGTHSAVRELCTEGSYQERFLLHAKCMTKVKPQYEQCASTYQQAIAAAHNNNATNQHSDDKIKTVCCSFHTYTSCSVNIVRAECGDDSAEFTREFLHKLGDTLIKMHCREYPEGSAQCAEYSSYNSSSSGVAPSGLFTILTIFLIASLSQIWNRN